MGAKQQPAAQSKAARRAVRPIKPALAVAERRTGCKADKFNGEKWTQAKASGCPQRQTRVRPHSDRGKKKRERMAGNEDDEEEMRKKPHRLRPLAQAPEPMERRCFAVKEGLQPGGTAAFMPPRLYRRAAHGKY